MYHKQYFLQQAKKGQKCTNNGQNIKKNEQIWTNMNKNRTTHGNKMDK